MRNAVACVSCRSARQRCIHVDAQPPCERCKTAGRTDECRFPPPGTSAIHRAPKRPRRSISGSTPPSQSAQAPPRPEVATRSPTGNPGSLLDGLDPFELLTDDVKNSYLRCSYKWSFHHTPTLLRQIRDRTLDSWMVWAILALAIRFVKDTPAPFKTQTEASNAFAAHARQLLQPELERPSVSRVQALLMLTGHDWGAGNGQRAWMYLGWAIRLVQVMELTQEPKMPVNRRPTREEFIDAEVRRRTAWTAFLMDSLLSGGKGRKRSLTADDMAIQLPCERENFVFGAAVCTEHLGGGQVPTSQFSQPTGELGIIAFSMRVANIWGKVARWACSEVVNSELPWMPTSEFQRLISELNEWKNSLPDRLKYDLFSLQSYNAMDQGQAYCYMHSICFMSHMFLRRAYLPFLGGPLSEETFSSYNDMPDMWNNFQKRSRRELFRESAMVLEMLEEMKSFGIYFLRGLVPWIGFTIYTAVGVMLYSYNFPSPEDDPSITAKARDRVFRGRKFLKDMQSQWPMAETWFETIKRMTAYYHSVATHDSPVSPDERQALRRAMVDYGALQQTSPVQKFGDSRAPGTPAVIQGPSPAGPSPEWQQTSITTPATWNGSPLATPNAPMHPTWNPQNITPSLEDDQFFDVDDNLTLEEMMRTAQSFFVAFPGEVGAMPYV